MIRGVTFDWWHTIAETPRPDYDARMRTARVEQIASALSAHRPRMEAEVLYRSYDRHTRLLEDHWHRNRDLQPDEQIDAFLEFAGLDPSDARLRETIANAFGEAIRAEPPVLDPHIRETLERLRAAGYRIGLVSNTGRTWAASSGRSRMGWASVASSMSPWRRWDSAPRRRSTSGTTSWPTSRGASESGCAWSGSTTGCRRNTPCTPGPRRSTRAPMRRFATAAISRGSWRRGGEGDRRGASNSGADQVPRPRRPRPPPAVPRFNQRLHRAAQQPHDHRVRRVRPRPSDDRRSRRDRAGHGANPRGRRSDPGPRLPGQTVPHGLGERLPIEHRPRRERLRLRGIGDGGGACGRVAPEPRRPFPVRSPRGRLGNAIRDRGIQQVEDGPDGRGLLRGATRRHGPGDRDDRRVGSRVQANGGCAPRGVDVPVLPRPARRDAPPHRGDGTRDPETGCGRDLRPRRARHAHAPRHHHDGHRGNAH